MGPLSDRLVQMEGVHSSSQQDGLIDLSHTCCGLWESFVDDFIVISIFWINWSIYFSWWEEANIFICWLLNWRWIWGKSYHFSVLSIPINRTFPNMNIVLNAFPRHEDSYLSSFLELLFQFWYSQTHNIVTFLIPVSFAWFLVLVTHHHPIKPPQCQQDPHPMLEDHNSGDINKLHSLCHSFWWTNLWMCNAVAAGLDSWHYFPQHDHYCQCY